MPFPAIVLSDYYLSWLPGFLAFWLSGFPAYLAFLAFLAFLAYAPTSWLAQLNLPRALASWPCN